MAHPERHLSDPEERRFRALLDRRCAGEPFAYLFREKEFWGRSFVVDRRVLVPRPETEHLVEAVLERVGSSPLRILEVGTGSGCVAITLALELERARIVATDSSLAALAVASTNRRRHGATLHLLAARTLAGLVVARFEMIVANLPYIDTTNAAELSPEVREWEPASALFAGASGLAAFRDLFTQAGALRAGTLLLLEIGADQAAAVVRLGAEYDLALEERIEDYAGHDRVLVLRRG